MYMSNGEIVRLYRQGKDKTKQVKILADLNLCHWSEIVRILQEAGEPLRFVDSRKRAKT